MSRHDPLGPVFCIWCRQQSALFNLHTGYAVEFGHDCPHRGPLFNHRGRRRQQWFAFEATTVYIAAEPGPIDLFKRLRDP